MNRQYIDFVPVKEKAVSTVKKQSVGTGAKRTSTVVRQRTEVNELEVSKVFAAREVKPRAGVTTVKNRNVVSNDVRPRFVRTEVEKRPLSKSVAQKKIVSGAPKQEQEAPSKPVTIIHKPEKDSKVGLIVTIIITIILGAAAGTVAFLLLPK
jgi:hypothetical protein